jgi:hypothetical protein
VNDPLPPQEESVAARRTRVLARMGTSRSALRAKNQAKVNSEAPSSAQLRTAVGAQFTHASPLATSLASPNAPNRRRVARWLCDSWSATRDHCGGAPFAARGNRSRGAGYGYALGARSVSKGAFT